MRNLVQWIVLASAAAAAVAPAGDAWGAATAARPAAAAAPAAPAWPMRQEGPYLVIETPHYTFRTEHSAEIGQLMAGQQEAVFQELYRRLSSARAAVQQMQRLQIVVYKTKEKYLEVMGKDAEGSQGRYMPARNMISGWMPADEIDHMLDTLRHEGTHQFVEQFIGPKCPLWLNEGLAEYFERSRFKDGQLQPGQVPATTLSALKRAMDSGKLIPLARMLNMSSAEWLAAVQVGTPQAALQYKEAWSMVHFLQGADNGKYRAPLMQFIQYIARSMPVAESWDNAFGPGSTAAFERRWIDYLKELKPTTGLGCRWNLQVLGFLLTRAEGAEWKSIDAVYQAATEGKLGGWVLTLGDGTRIEGTDKDVMRSVFRCPDDTTPGGRPSYELFAGKDGDPLGVRCRHHPGYVLETSYDKDDKGGLKINVVSRPAPSSAPAPKPAGK